MKKGFTLIELIIVIIIIGILSTLGFTQYTRVIEKGRSAEAKVILGQVRSAQVAYNSEYATFGGSSNIYVSAPTTCTATHYFSYTATAGSDIGSATRCTSGGKNPTGPAYSVTVNYSSGVWSGSVGYY
jgi:prepilin-type N-terminal cleavage/methylation domain-containing protein